MSKHKVMNELRRFAKDTGYGKKPFMKKFRKKLLDLWDGEIPEERHEDVNHHDIFYYKGAKLSLVVTIGMSIFPMIHDISYDDVPVENITIYKDSLDTRMQILKDRINNGRLENV